MERSFLCTTFVCMLLIVSLSFSMNMTSVGAQSTPQLYIDPSKVEYWIPACGEIFKVNVSIANVSNLQSFEFKLYWNTTLLDLVEVEPQPFLKPIVFPFRYEINETLGRLWLNLTTIYGPPTNGSGALVTLSFQITYEPVWPENATSALDLADTKLLDSNGVFIPHDVYDGEYSCYPTSYLSLTATTDKPFYDTNEAIHVYGNLTLGFSPVQDGLVALQVDNPQNQFFVIRTLPTGTPPTSPIIEIVDVYSSTQEGSPKNNFYRGYFAYFNITVKNNDNITRRVLVTINLYDSTNTPIGIHAVEQPVAAGATISYILSTLIPLTASVGEARVYANALTGWPRDSGTAYCPEKSDTFNIVNGAAAATAPTTISSLTESDGNYSLTFKLPPDATAGIYQVYASASYQEHSSTGRTSFGVSAIYVPDHYLTIQQAIDAASPTNNSILVMPGTYNEDVSINQTLTLVGRDPRAGRTIIKGSGTGTVVTVTADSVTVSGFTIRNSGSSFSDSGITLKNSSGSTISENTIIKNYYGINIHSSNNNFILDNKLSGNNYGIYLNHSTNNELRDNNMICNKYSFGVFGDSISDFTHDIDTSNTVNGKPVIYWVNRQDREVPSNAGFVAIVGSTNIAVRGLDLTKNVQGVLFAFTNDSVIERVNTLSNEYGIYLAYSYSNTIIGSEVSNNFVGIYQRNSNGSTIYHNNFINNINQTELYQSSNTWDDGDGKGNHWSDYTGVDDGSGGRIAGDGVGDTLLPHQGVDWYPLMNPWILVHDVAVTSVTYTVTPYNGSHVFPAPGWSVIVTVTVENEGDSIETFNVSAYANTTIIQTQTVTLPVRSSTTVNLTWNMDENVAIGNYTISATATQVPGETDTADNSYTDGTIKVVSEPNPDINGDGIVDIVDVVIVALAFGSEPGDPNWNPDADLNGDGIVDIVDVVFVAIHFGETYP